MSCEQITSNNNNDDNINNEEIVNDLIKDLNLEQKPMPKEVVANVNKTNEDTESDNENPTTSIDEDFVDEVALKDLEVTLTESECEERRSESLELKDQANGLYQEGKYEESLQVYTKGLRLCPLKFCKERSILYANRAAAKIKLKLNKPAIEDCTKCIELDNMYLKAYVRRAKLHEEEKRLDEALEDYKKILELDSGNNEAQSAVRRLPSEIEKRNEELKTEMIGKLKDLGNMFLRPFGLSTNNFQLKQDPNTGSYSVNFQQNSN